MFFFRNEGYLCPRFFVALKPILTHKVFMQKSVFYDFIITA